MNSRKTCEVESVGLGEGLRIIFSKVTSPRGWLVSSEARLWVLTEPGHRVRFVKFLFKLQILGMGWESNRGPQGPGVIDKI